jgi:hypothetical protein
LDWSFGKIFTDNQEKDRGQKQKDIQFRCAALGIIFLIFSAGKQVYKTAYLASQGL